MLCFQDSETEKSEKDQLDLIAEDETQNELDSESSEEEAAPESEVEGGYKTGKDNSHFHFVL